MPPHIFEYEMQGDGYCEVQSEDTAKISGTLSGLSMAGWRMVEWYDWSLYFSCMVFSL